MGMARDLLNAADTSSARIAKLETALQELEGFAKRNVERAKKAQEGAIEAVNAVKNPGDPIWGVRRKALTEATARLHEANRFYDVVRMRVAEALAP